jgi:hypothetical protein
MTMMYSLSAAIYSFLSNIYAYMYELAVFCK